VLYLKCEVIVMMVQSSIHRRLSDKVQLEIAGRKSVYQIVTVG